jgi:outer membrane biogenesis lipoprotein LolB
MIKNLITLSSCFLLTACVAGNKVVPSTKIKWKPATGQVEIIAPKNSVLENFEIQRSGSNVVIKLQKGSFANDPEVVNQSYSGQAAIFQAGFNSAIEAIKVATEIIKSK